MRPVFAVVGRSNKGKSSIVATLTENDEVVIAPTPRTTQERKRFTLRAGGREVLALIDTPGFEEAAAALEWMKSRPVTADRRGERVREFLVAFEGTDRFRYERELLKPIVEGDGAVILYVVDASHPFRANYENEFEILLWTGRPSMALINAVGEPRYIDEWRRALEQFFKKVRVFDAHRSAFLDRVELLEELKTIDTALRAPLEEAIGVLQRERKARLDECSKLLADFLGTAIQFRVSGKAAGAEPTAAEIDELGRRYHEGLRTLEGKLRRDLARQLNHASVEELQSSPEQPLYAKDLFSRETWELSGLSRSKLVIAGTVGGALAGTTIDAAVGGTSFLLGTGLGALFGGASSAFLALSEPEIAGVRISRTRVTVGPNENPNFPWILLDRNVAYLEALLQRTHARRDPLTVPAEGARRGPSSRLPPSDLNLLAALFRAVRWGIGVERVYDALALRIRGILPAT